MIAVILTCLPWLASAPAPALQPLAPQPVQAEVQAARVKKGVTAQVRPFFDRKTPLLLELKEGSAVEVVRQAVPWSEVRVPGGLVVWVHGEYVNWQDGLVYPKNSRLRARPKPSTAADSHPVGKLKAEWGLQVLARDGEWLKVLAPEELSAWVLTEQLDVLDSKPSSWGLGWKAAGNKRRKAMLATAEVVEPLPEVEAEATPEKAETGEVAQAEPNKVDVGAGEAPPVTQTPAEAGQTTGTEQATQPVQPAATQARPVNANATSEPATATPATAMRSARLDHLVSAEVLKKQPRKAFELAIENLNAHRSEVTSEPDLFSAALLENVDEVMTAVLMSSRDTQVVEEARTALIRADALRKFHRSTMEARARKAEVEQGAAPKAVQKEMQRLGGQGEGTWVGYIKYKPHQYPSTPFVAVRGDREVVVHSFDGRFYLKDYVGREVVLRGKWRATGEGGETKILAVEKLRVLPAKRSN